MNLTNRQTWGKGTRKMTQSEPQGPLNRTTESLRDEILSAAIKSMPGEDIVAEAMQVWCALTAAECVVAGLVSHTDWEAFKVQGHELALQQIYTLVDENDMNAVWGDDLSQLSERIGVRSLRGMKPNLRLITPDNDT